MVMRCDNLCEAPVAILEVWPDVSFGAFKKGVGICNNRRRSKLPVLLARRFGVCPAFSAIVAAPSAERAAAPRAFDADLERRVIITDEANDCPPDLTKKIGRHAHILRHNILKEQFFQFAVRHIVIKANGEAGGCRRVVEQIAKVRDGLLDLVGVSTIDDNMNGIGTAPKYCHNNPSN